MQTTHINVSQGQQPRKMDGYNGLSAVPVQVWTNW